MDKNILALYRKIYLSTFKILNATGLLKINAIRNLGRRANLMLYGSLARKRPSLVTINGYKMKLDQKDFTISSVSLDLVLNKTWERDTTEIVKNNLKGGMVFLDLGAHIGYFTLLASSLVGIEGKVYAFEPDTSNFSLIEENVKLNNFRNVVAVRKGVSDKTTKAFLYLASDNSGGHRIWDDNEGDRKRTEIETVALDDFFRNKEDEIDFIKMDVEGAEMSALKGMSGILTKNKKLRMITEFYPNLLKKNGVSPEDYLEKLSSFGFNLKVITNVGLKKTNTKELIKSWENSKNPELFYVNIFLER